MSANCANSFSIHLRCCKLFEIVCQVYKPVVFLLDFLSCFIYYFSMLTQKKPLKTKGKGNNPNSQANLVLGRAKLAELRKNGVLTNPNGYSLTAAIKHQLAKEADFISPTATPNTKLWGEQITRAILVRAASGDVPMVKEVWDRVDGKVNDPDKGNTYTDIKILIVRERPKGIQEASEG